MSDQSAKQDFNRLSKLLCIRLNSGPVYTSAAFTFWAMEQGVQTQNMQSGKPMQIPFIETLLQNLQGKQFGSLYFL